MDDTEQKIKKYILGDRVHGDKVNISIDLVNSVLTANIPHSLVKKTLSQAMAFNIKKINITTCD